MSHSKYFRLATVFLVGAAAVSRPASAQTELNSHDQTAPLPFQTAFSPEELKEAKVWTDTQVDLVTPGITATFFKVPARWVVLRLPKLESDLAVLADPQTKTSYLVRAGQFYLEHGADLFPCLVGPGDFMYGPSILSMSGNTDKLIASLPATITERRLLENHNNGTRVNLTPGVPFQFWTHGSGFNSQPGDPTIVGVSLSDNLLRLNLKSNGGKYRGSFWIDLEHGTLERSTVDDKEVYSADKASDLVAILNALPNQMPELHKFGIEQHETVASGTYSVTNPLLTSPVGVWITSYPSPEEAERGVQASLHITSIAPEEQHLEGLTVYKWEAGPRLFARVGVYTLDVASTDSLSPPAVTKIFVTLAQRLRNECGQSTDTSAHCKGQAP